VIPSRPRKEPVVTPGEARQGWPAVGSTGSAGVVASSVAGGPAVGDGAESFGATVPREGCATERSLVELSSTEGATAEAGASAAGRVLWADTADSVPVPTAQAPATTAMAPTASRYLTARTIPEKLVPCGRRRCDYSSPRSADPRGLVAGSGPWLGDVRIEVLEGAWRNLALLDIRVYVVLFEPYHAAESVGLDVALIDKAVQRSRGYAETARRRRCREPLYLICHDGHVSPSRGVSPHFDLIQPDAPRSGRC